MLSIFGNAQNRTQSNHQPHHPMNPHKNHANKLQKNQNHTQSQLSASRLFSSCPSLPDLTAAANNGMWPTQQTIGLNNDRRKSWTAIEDLTIECGKSSHKR